MTFSMQFVYYLLHYALPLPGASVHVIVTLRMDRILIAFHTSHKYLNTHEQSGFLYNEHRNNTWFIDQL